MTALNIFMQTVVSLTIENLKIRYETQKTGILEGLPNIELILFEYICEVKQGLPQNMLVGDYQQKKKQGFQ